MRPASSLALPLLLSAAAFGAAAPAGAAEEAAGPSRLESLLLEDVADRRLDHFTLLEAGLIVGGVRDDATLQADRARLEAALEPLLKAVDRRSPRAAARSLLQVLHRGAGRASPMLRSYEARATTLSEVLARGRFNCVSATLLYLVAAERLGLDARAVLLPSHARAVVALDGARVEVETTSPNGFAASAETSRELQRRFRPVRDDEAVELYGDERGTEVDDVALLGVVLTNLGASARQRNDLAGAQALQARAELFVAPSARPMLQLVHASMLGELAIERLAAGKTSEALELALQAAQIVPPGDDARLALHNLKAIAQRRLDELEPDERGLLAFPDRFRAFPEVQRDLRSRAWSRVGMERSRRGDLEGAAAAAKEAARLGDGGPARGALAHNVGVAELHRLAELARSDVDRAWAEWKAFTAPPELAASRRQLGANLALQRAQRALDAGRCAELEKRLAELTELRPEVPADAMRAACRNDEGLAKWKTGDFKAAAASFREAMRLNPDEKAFRQNLLGALGNEVSRLLKARRCREAGGLIAEGMRLDPDDRFFRDASRFCDGAPAR